MVGTYPDAVGWAFEAPVLCDGTGEYTGGVGRSGTPPA
jgi:hypothetical protein